MKPLLFALLAASLAANVVLGLRARHATSPATTGRSSVSSSFSTSSVAAGQVEAPGVATLSASTASGTASAVGELASAAALITWQPNGSEQDLQRVVATLRAAGYPPSVVRAVVGQLLNERFASRNPNAGQPYWKQQAAPTPETQAAQRALWRERQALYESLLGADARPSASLDAEGRLRRYGNLSDDKVDAIARIERDYGEMSSEAFAQRRGNTVADAETMMQTQQLMEQEKLADLAAALTPEELAQYEMRNSQSARTLMRNLRNVEVTEQEYAQLYEAQKAFDAANPRRATMDGSSYAQRQSAQAALNEQARALLGENRFYAYLEGTDGNYANIVRTLSAFPTVSPPVSYQVYQLQTELQRTMAQVARDGPPSPDKIAGMRATTEAFNSRLEALIGPEAAEAYRKQGMGRMFNSSRPQPAVSLQPTGR
ncbi:MAG: hypothetical protein ACOZE5_18145 [Verrucomicrobiota bacterium]